MSRFSRRSRSETAASPLSWMLGRAGTQDLRPSGSPPPRRRWPRRRARGRCPVTVPGCQPVGDAGHVDRRGEPAGGLGATPCRAPLQDPAVADRGGPPLGHHHRHRSGDDDVRRAPVGLDQALGEQVPADGGHRARRAVQAEATPPGQRPRRGRASGVGWGTSGSRCARTPTASRISSSSGNAAGSIGGVPNRRGAEGQGRGTSSRPRPGAAVASTRSASPRRSARVRRRRG